MIDQAYIKERMKNVEANIIGCFWHNPFLFFDYSELSNNDFKNGVWKLYFSIGKKMASKNLKKIDEVAVELFLENKEKILTAYNNYGGFETIRELEYYCTIENVEVYVKELKKWNTVHDMIDKFAFTEESVNKINDLNVEEVYRYYSATLNNIFINVNDDVETSKLNEGIDKIIEEADKGLKKGMPFNSPILSNEVGGWINGQTYLIGGLSGSGKAQTMDSKILTKDGYVQMKDIKLDDDIFGEDGKLHKVIGIYPQGTKDIYEVVLSDGSVVKCCKNHLWTYQTPYDKVKGTYHTEELKEIINKNELYVIGKDGYKKWQYYIPITKPIEFEGAISNLDNYFLGLFLGDGSSGGNRVAMTTGEKDILECVFKYLNKFGNPIIYKDKRRGNTYNINLNDKNGFIKNELENLKMFGCGAKEKFIPKEILMQPIKERIDLLSGLIDSDGEVDKGGYIYSTISKQLSLDIQFLVHSLGGTAKISTRQTKYTYKGEKKNGQLSYRLYIKFNEDIKPFRSEKHKNKYIKGNVGVKRTIKEIKYIGKEECQCIMTNNPTHLYLTDNMVVTHNTTFVQDVLLSAIWELDEPCVVCLNEQDHVKWKEQFLTWIINNHILKNSAVHFSSKRWRDGGFTKEEFRWLNQASKMLKDKEIGEKIIFVHFKSYSQRSAERIIKKYADLGIKKFVIDTFKLSADRGDDDSFWLSMQEDMRKFDDLVKASNLNVGLVCTLQLQKGSRLLRYLTSDNIGMAKNTIDVASVALLMRRVYNDEYSGEAHELKVKKPIEGTECFEEVILDPKKNYVVIFIEKNRNGESQTYQVVAEQNLGALIYKEIGIVDIPVC